MEPHGAVALIRDLYDTGIAFGAELVVDDDCSTKANTRHSFQDLINEKIWANKATCWPKKNKNMQTITANYRCEYRPSKDILPTQCIDVKVLEEIFSNLLNKKEKN